MFVYTVHILVYNLYLFDLEFYVQFNTASHVEPIC